MLVTMRPVEQSLCASRSRLREYTLCGLKAMVLTSMCRKELSEINPGRLVIMKILKVVYAVCVKSYATKIRVSEEVRVTCLVEEV